MPQTNICLHPVWLLARTDSAISKLYHSFFLSSFNNNREIDVIERIPSTRPDIDDIESGLKLFLKEAIEYGTPADPVECGSFAVTTSMGIRYFLTWRSLKMGHIILSRPHQCQ